MAQKVYVGDTGTLIRFRFPATEAFPTGVTTVSIAYKKPSGAIGEWPATLVASPDPNYSAYVEYVTQTGDLDEAGTWWLQAKITSSSWSGRSNSVRLPVYDAFE